MKKFIVDEKNTGQKLFRYIKNILPGLKNNDIFKLVRKKIVKVNNAKVDSDYILEKNDRIEIFLNDSHFEEKGKSKKFHSVDKNLSVVYEDSDILVINKPVGLLSQPDKTDYKNNVYEIARSYLYSKNEYDPKDVFSPAPCHRLDKNTSGLMVVAKNHPALQNVTAMIRERKTEKIYKTIVCGRINKPLFISSEIDAENEKVGIKNLCIADNPPSDKIAFLNTNPGLSALAVYPERTGNQISLINVDLWTGKKHQIRAQLTAAGFPLLGDKKYYNSFSRGITDSLDVERYFLHAYKLSLENYPVFEAPLPEDFKAAIEFFLKGKKR